MFRHSMFGVFEVQYFGVRSKTILFTTDWSGLFQIDAFVWHSILFMSLGKQNSVANKNTNMDE